MNLSVYYFLYEVDVFRKDETTKNDYLSLRHTLYVHIAPIMKTIAYLKIWKAKNIMKNDPSKIAKVNGLSTALD